MSRELSRRALGRATLARQHLLERGTLSPAEMIEHLVGLQAQAAPQPPYLGLWSRIAGFQPPALTELLERRQAVRTALLRGTIHLVAAEDCLTLRPLLQPVLERGFQGYHAKRLPGLDLTALTEHARELVEREPLTFRRLGELLAPSFPEYAPADLAQAARARLALVQVPPRGLWGRSGPAAHTTAEHWLGRPLDPQPSPDRLVLRYLAAFGPATAADVQKWSGLTGLGAVLTRLKPQLALFRDERGRTLYDLPDAPRPAESTPAPVRLLAPFDNLVLSHADRTRVLLEADKPRLMTVNGLIPGMLLVDGLVAGTWQLDGSTLRVSPFAPLRPADARAAEAEAGELLGFLGATELILG